MSDRDDRFRSRKFIIAAASLFVVSFLAGWAMTVIVTAGDASGAALVLGAWAAADGVVLKLYNDANIQDEGA